MKLLPIPVADPRCRTCFGGNGGNNDCADVAELVFVRQHGNTFVELFVTYVAYVAVDEKT